MADRDNYYYNNGQSMQDSSYSTYGSQGGYTPTGPLSDGQQVIEPVRRYDYGKVIGGVDAGTTAPPGRGPTRGVSVPAPVPVPASSLTQQVEAGSYLVAAAHTRAASSMTQATSYHHYSGQQVLPDHDSSSSAVPLLREVGFVPIQSGPLSPDVNQELAQIQRQSYLSVTSSSSSLSQNAALGVKQHRGLSVSPTMVPANSPTSWTLGGELYGGRAPTRALSPCPTRAEATEYLREALPRVVNVPQVQQQQQQSQHYAAASHGSVRVEERRTASQVLSPNTGRNDPAWLSATSTALGRARTPTRALSPLPVGQSPATRGRTPTRALSPSPYGQSPVVRGRTPTRALSPSPYGLSPAGRGRTPSRAVSPSPQLMSDSSVLLSVASDQSNARTRARTPTRDLPESASRAQAKEYLKEALPGLEQPFASLGSFQASPGMEGHLMPRAPAPVRAVSPAPGGMSSGSQFSSYQAVSSSHTAQEYLTSDSHMTRQTRYSNTGSIDSGSFTLTSSQQTREPRAPLQIEVSTPTFMSMSKTPTRGLSPSPYGQSPVIRGRTPTRALSPSPYGQSPAERGRTPTRALSPSPYGLSPAARGRTPSRAVSPSPQLLSDSSVLLSVASDQSNARTRARTPTRDLPESASRAQAKEYLKEALPGIDPQLQSQQQVSSFEAYQGSVNMNQYLYPGASTPMQTTAPHGTGHAGFAEASYQNEMTSQVQSSSLQVQSAGSTFAGNGSRTPTRALSPSPYGQSPAVRGRTPTRGLSPSPYGLSPSGRGRTPSRAVSPSPQLMSDSSVLLSVASDQSNVRTRARTPTRDLPDSASRAQAKEYLKEALPGLEQALQSQQQVSSFEAYQGSVNMNQYLYPGASTPMQTTAPHGTGHAGFAEASYQNKMTSQVQASSLQVQASGSTFAGNGSRTPTRALSPSPYGQSPAVRGRTPTRGLSPSGRGRTPSRAVSPSPQLLSDSSVLLSVASDQSNARTRARTPTRDLPESASRAQAKEYLKEALPGIEPQLQSNESFYKSESTQGSVFAQGYLTPRAVTPVRPFSPMAPDQQRLGVGRGQSPIRSPSPAMLSNGTGRGRSPFRMPSATGTPTPTPRVHSAPARLSPVIGRGRSPTQQAFSGSPRVQAGSPATRLSINSPGIGRGRSPVRVPSPCPTGYAGSPTRMSSPLFNGARTPMRGLSPARVPSPCPRGYAGSPARMTSPLSNGARTPIRGLSPAPTRSEASTYLSQVLPGATHQQRNGHAFYIPNNMDNAQPRARAVSLQPTEAPQRSSHAFYLHNNNIDNAQARTRAVSPRPTESSQRSSSRGGGKKKVKICDQPVSIYSNGYEGGTRRSRDGERTVKIPPAFTYRACRGRQVIRANFRTTAGKILSRGCAAFLIFIVFFHCFSFFIVFFKFFFFFFHFSFFFIFHFFFIFFFHIPSFFSFFITLLLPRMKQPWLDKYENVYQLIL